MATTDTANRLLDSAQALIVERGYNAFSFKDLADEVGIRTASIHYHFPTKGDLGVALMKRYLDGLDELLDGIDRSGRSHAGKLERLHKAYAQTETCGVLCLCGSLASDLRTLPEPLQAAVCDYLRRSERWLERVIAEGVADGEFAFDGRPIDAATAYLSSLQGGLVLSRTRGARASALAPIKRVFLKSLLGQG
ncbi:MAG: TetR/AcrR family transcriptional regulator [Planctomycetota bacterium]